MQDGRKDLPSPGPCLHSPLGFEKVPFFSSLRLACASNHVYSLCSVANALGVRGKSWLCGCLVSWYIQFLSIRRLCWRHNGFW